MTLTGNGTNQDIARSSDFHLIVEDDKIRDLGLWTQVSGLSVSWTPGPYAVGDSTDVWVCAGRTKYDNLSLTRPVCKSSASVQKWLRDTSRDTKPSPAAITLTDWKGGELIRWEIRACFPLSWKLSNIETGATKPMTETLQLVHTGFLEDAKDFRKHSSSASGAGH